MRTLVSGLRAAGEESRMRLLALCARSDLTVTELTQILRQSQPRVSRHLKVLCDAGLLQRLREGSWVFYRLADGGPNARLARDLVAALPPEDAELLRDGERLQDVKAARAEAAAAYFRTNAWRWDDIRALHVPERDVEQALVALVADQGIDDLLDVGTGSGRILDLLAPHVGRGVGIDMSREMLAVARANLERSGRSNCYVRLADMYGLPVADHSADLVTCHQVLHFADEPGRVVAEAARTLREGGRLVVVDFAPHDLEYLRAEHAHRRLGFSDDEMAGWLRSAGLEPAAPVRLAGDPLTVVLWSGRRPGEARPRMLPFAGAAE